MGGVEHLQIETIRPVDFPEDVSEDLLVHFDGDPRQLAFEVKDEASANWVVRKVAESRERAEKAKAWAEKEQAAAERAEQFFLARFGSQLVAWAASRLAQLGGKKRSVDLPAGRIGFRKQPGRLVVDQEDLALAWARVNCSAAVTVIPAKLVLGKKAIAEHFEKTGEVPPGCRYQDEKDEMYVR